MPHRIVLLGANGSGKSTLGRELARVLNCAHFDVEDYWFCKSDVPYTAVRPPKERNEMLLADMNKHGSFVVSGDISGWGKEFLTMFDLAILLSVPTDTRLKRIEGREYERWGDRVREGGDMYEQQQRFREFAATRDIALLEQQALAYSCPLVHIDGTNALHATAVRIVERFCTKLRFVVAGLGKDRIAQAIARAGGDRVTVAVKTDIEGALAIQTGQADAYVGACNSGAGGALAIATALLGAAQTVTLTEGSRAAAPAAIVAAVAAGKRAFGLRNEDIDRVVPELVTALLARATE